MTNWLLLIILIVIAPVSLLAEDIPEVEDVSVTKTLLWPDGTRYVGGVKNGKRFGKGTIFWQDGTRFVGTFEDDQRNGPGTMILPDGTVYNGYFQNDSLVERLDGETTAHSEPTAPIAEISASDVKTPIKADPVEATPATNKSIKASKPETSIAQANTQSDSVAPAPVKDPGQITTLTQDTREQIQAAIDLWAAAWSDQNTDQYLAIYSADFNVPGRLTRSQWEGMRRSRLTRPSRIDVKVSYNSFEVVAPDTVRVDFNQVYESNLFTDKTNKLLVMQKEGDLWRIVSEQSL